LCSADVDASSFDVLLALQTLRIAIHRRKGATLKFLFIVMLFLFPHAGCFRFWHIATELLRVKGSILLSMPQPRADDAEAHFMRSLELSRRQGARAWEFRTATDLATLLAGQGRPESARALLQPAFEQFVEGSDTADLKAAERLLATLD
jgi:hypothetical protein